MLLILLVFLHYPFWKSFSFHSYNSDISIYINVCVPWSVLKKIFTITIPMKSYSFSFPKICLYNVLFKRRSRLPCDWILTRTLASIGFPSFNCLSFFVESGKKEVCRGGNRLLAVQALESASEPKMFEFLKTTQKQSSCL